MGHVPNLKRKREDGNESIVPKKKKILFSESQVSNDSFIFSQPPLAKQETIKIPQMYDIYVPKRKRKSESPIKASKKSKREAEVQVELISAPSSPKATANTASKEASPITISKPPTPEPEHTPIRQISKLKKEEAPDTPMCKPADKAPFQFIAGNDTVKTPSPKEEKQFQFTAAPMDLSETPVKQPTAPKFTMDSVLNIQKPAESMFGGDAGNNLFNFSSQSAVPVFAPQPTAPQFNFQAAPTPNPAPFNSFGAQSQPPSSQGSFSHALPQQTSRPMRRR